ncbi:hypothetical protein ACFXDH_50925 [Streptomyces sp. NPDC059467]|uniref:hypothetical protein n=1 Tax=Streptomyces sp. NPDC059467 TaxID=3346844 RepID=UPI0036C2F6BF
MATVVPHPELLAYESRQDAQPSGPPPAAPVIAPLSGMFRRDGSIRIQLRNIRDFPQGKSILNWLIVDSCDR